MSVELATKPSLTISRRIKAPPAKVFAAWTQAAQLAQWFGPEQISQVSAEIDARPGGRFRVVMREQNGEQHEVGGIYREVIPDRKLVFSWSWISTSERESLVTVQLKPDAEGTLLTLTHEQLFDETVRDGHARGWAGSLNKLEEYLT